MTKDYSTLRELLSEQEKFPLRYLHKFIGKNSPAFLMGVQCLEAAFPKLKQQSRRESGAKAHVALTFEFEADSADEVIQVLEATEVLPDLVLVL